MSEENPSVASQAVPIAAKKRQRFQFGLRSWIFFITVVSLTLGLAGRCYDRVRRQSAAIDYLQSRGFSVTHEIPSGLTGMVLGGTGESWPIWQRHLLLEVVSAQQRPATNTSTAMGTTTKTRDELDPYFWIHLAQLPKIRSLNVCDPLPEGRRFKEMPFRRCLTIVTVSDTLRADDIEQLGDCPHLAALSIRAGQDCDAALARLPRLTRLERLTISDASEEAVAAWCQWSTLRSLSVEHAEGVPGETWARLVTNNPNLRTLSLHGVTSASKVCDAVKNSIELASLDLTASDLDDSGLKVLANLPRLETLQLGGTKVSGSGFEPRNTEDWPALKTLGLSRMALNVEGVQALAKLPRLRELEISGDGRRMTMLFPR